MRQRVWQLSERYFSPGQTILELGCGTGIDAIHFASQGLNWWATDSSSTMLELTNRKGKAITNKDKIHIHQFDINEPNKAKAINQDNAFDGIFANFGVLNCIHNLEKFCEFSSEILKEEGILFANVMSKTCLWEIGYYLLRGYPLKAFRRFKKSKSLVPIGDRFIDTQYFSTNHFIDSLKNNFQLEVIYGLGVVVPPPYLNGWIERHPKIFAAMKWTDQKISTFPVICGLGDHFIVVLRKVHQ